MDQSKCDRGPLQLTGGLHPQCPPLGFRGTGTSIQHDNVARVTQADEQLMGPLEMVWYMARTQHGMLDTVHCC